MWFFLKKMSLWLLSSGLFLDFLSLSRAQSVEIYMSTIEVTVLFLQIQLILCFKLFKDCLPNDVTWWELIGSMIHWEYIDKRFIIFTMLIINGLNMFSHQSNKMTVLLQF